MVNLGDRVRDKVTGFEVVATARYQYMNGCERYCVEPMVDKGGKLVDAQTFDVQRLDVVQPRVASVKASNTGGARDNPSRSDRHASR